MDITTGHILMALTPVNSSDNLPSRCPSRTTNADRQQHATKRVEMVSDQQVPSDADAKSAELPTVKQVLEVLREGMDVTGFLDLLCWGSCWGG